MENDGLRERVERSVDILGCSTSNVIDELLAAVWNFQVNRELDEQSRTVGRLKWELLDIASTPAARLEARLSFLSDFELAALFGDMPGSSVELSIDGGDRHMRLLPENQSLLGAAFKTLTRIGDDDFAPTGMVYRRRADTIADHIPPDASIETLSRFLGGLAAIVSDGSDSPERKEFRIGLMAHLLSLGGSVGSATVHSALADRFLRLAPDQQAEFVAEIACPCLESVEATVAGTARGLACVIFDDFLEHAPSDERKPVLALFADCFPDAFAEFVRMLAERVDRQYRLELSQRSGRRDARRWHTAHAGWKLIDDVLDAVWPVHRHEPGPQERSAITSIIWLILESADREHSRPKVTRKRRAGSGRRSEDGGVKAAGDSEPVVNVSNLMVNVDHVKQLIGLRSAMHKLDIVLTVLNRRALFELEPKSRSCIEAARELEELRPAIGSIQLWRRELAYKREHGDYQRVKPGEPRATGTRIPLPRMPQVKAETLANDEAAVRKIITAAEVLSPAKS